MKILCVCYSLTGKTKKAAEKLAEVMKAEEFDIAEIKEKHPKNRKGMFGMLRSGMDAMSNRTSPVTFEMPKVMEHYDVVIVAAPVWAGRCASPVRSFLKLHGSEIKAPAYLITRASEKNDYAQVFEQMDKYTAEPHKYAVSLQDGSTDYLVKLYGFARKLTGTE